MHKAIKFWPVAGKFAKELFDFSIRRDVTGEDEFAAEFLCHLDHAVLDPVPLIGERQFGALSLHRLSCTVGNRAVAEDAGNKNAFICQKSHVFLSSNWLRTADAARIITQ